MFQWAPDQKVEPSGACPDTEELAEECFKGIRERACGPQGGNLRFRIGHLPPPCRVRLLISHVVRSGAHCKEHYRMEPITG